MTSDAPPRGALPDAVRDVLDEFGKRFDVSLTVRVRDDADGGAPLYPLTANGSQPSGEAPAVHAISPRDGPELEIELRGAERYAEALAATIGSAVERTYDFVHEIRFFTRELSERYEEINLLYSISETLGSILRLDDAARAILGEVCDVLGALRGSLWVYDAPTDVLRLTASVGAEGISGPLRADDPHAVTARVFREGYPRIAFREGPPQGDGLPGLDLGDVDSFLSVPIRYTPPAGEARTVGVLNLIGRRRGGRFTASDQKLVTAIASQIGAALENNRLIQESLAQERVAREMELAHDLQMKLLPAVEKFDGADVAARVEPAASVGGDFYHLFKLSEGRVGIMIGDVSSHGFPAALIMALSISAATIYASESFAPADVLRHMDDALRGELETTEMYLTLFYGVIEPEKGRLVYSNAGHPHAFVVRANGEYVRLGATDPPVGIAGPDAYGQEEVTWARAEDLLVLFTDGLCDRLGGGTHGGPSGERRVLSEVVAYRESSAKEIVSALFELRESEAPHNASDDCTAIVLRT